MMKRFVLSATILAAFTGCAFAADLPSRKAAPVYAPPPPMWTGFYAGLNAGYGFGTANGAQTIATPLSTYPGIETTPEYFTNPWFPALANVANTNFTQNGFIGGGQVGYNYQWGSNIVVGLEADIQGSAIRGANGYVGGATTEEGIIAGGIESESTYNALGYGRVEGGVNWLGTVRGRLGYLFTPTLLIFGTGGLSYGGVYANASHNFSMVYAYDGSTYNSAANYGSINNTRVGWTAGGGLEWMFMPNWSVKTEALYYDLGSQNLFTSAFAGNVSGYSGGYVGSVQDTRVSYNGVIARAGVNYHFNWGAAPVVASY